MKYNKVKVNELIKLLTEYSQKYENGGDDEIEGMVYVNDTAFTGLALKEGICKNGKYCQLFFDDCYELY